MPRYKYQCDECDKVIVVLHCINDEYIEACEFCGVAKMKKILSTPLYDLSVDASPESTGDLTKEYIESNREILQQMRQESKEYTHEPS